MVTQLLGLSEGDAKQAKSALEFYGVDIAGGTKLGEGAFKEVHAANIPGHAVIITDDLPQLEQEIEVLAALSKNGIPVMEYYLIEKYGKMQIALVQRLWPIASWLDGPRRDELRDEIRGWLCVMVNAGLYPRDLQFMLDADDRPVFMDPLGWQVGNWRRCRGLRACYANKSLETGFGVSVGAAEAKRLGREAKPLLGAAR